MSSAKSRRIRLLLVSHTLDRGGLEEAVYATAAGLDQTLFDVHVAFFAGGDVSSRLDAVPGIRTSRIDSRGRVARLLALASHVRSLRADILHNHFCWYGLAAGMLGGAKRIETVHNQYGWFSPVQQLAYDTHCRLAHRMVAVSESARGYTASRFPSTAHKRWEVIHNGIDPSRFRRIAAENLRSMLGIPPSAVVAGFSGRLEEEKGVRVLLEAAAILRRTSPGVRFLIAGSGSQEQSLRAAAASGGLSNVQFTGYRTDIADLYSVFDLLVIPSAYEGMPLALLEAMACGCPVAAFRVGGIPEAVTDGVHGYLARAGSVEDLAAGIARIAGDRERRAAMGAAAERRVAEEFSVTTMIARLQTLYLDLFRGVAA